MGADIPVENTPNASKNFSPKWVSVVRAPDSTCHKKIVRGTSWYIKNNIKDMKLNQIKDVYSS